MVSNIFIAFYLTLYLDNLPSEWHHSILNLHMIFSPRWFWAKDRIFLHNYRIFPICLIEKLLIFTIMRCFFISFSWKILNCFYSSCHNRLRAISLGNPSNLFFWILYFTFASLWLVYRVTVNNWFTRSTFFRSTNYAFP